MASSMMNFKWIPVFLGICISYSVHYDALATLPNSDAGQALLRGTQLEKLFGPIADHLQKMILNDVDLNSQSFNIIIKLSSPMQKEAAEQALGVQALGNRRTVLLVDATAEKILELTSSSIVRFIEINGEVVRVKGNCEQDLSDPS